MYAHLRAASVQFSPAHHSGDVSVLSEERRGDVDRHGYERRKAEGGSRSGSQLRTNDASDHPSMRRLEAGKHRAATNMHAYTRPTPSGWSARAAVRLGTAPPPAHTGSRPGDQRQRRQGLLRSILPRSTPATSGQCRREPFLGLPSVGTTAGRSGRGRGVIERTHARPACDADGGGRVPTSER